MDFDVVDGIIVRLVNVLLTFVLLQFLLPFLTNRDASILLILPAKVEEVELVNLEETERIQ